MDSCRMKIKNYVFVRQWDEVLSMSNNNKNRLTLLLIQVLKITEKDIYCKDDMLTRGKISEIQSLYIL